MQEKIKQLLQKKDLAEVKRGLTLLTLHPNFANVLLPSPLQDSSGWWIGDPEHFCPHLAFAQLWWLCHLSRNNQLPKGQPRQLRIKDGSLTQLPQNIGDLWALQELWLPDQKLRFLPTSFQNLTQLKRLGLQRNQFKKLPKWIGNLKELRVLHLQGNPLGKVPTAIGDVQKLREIDLRNCHVQSLPWEMANLSELEILDLRHNHLTEAPEVLYHMPKNTKIRLFGNPIAPQKTGPYSMVDDSSSFAIEPDSTDAKYIARHRYRQRKQKPNQPTDTGIFNIPAARQKLLTLNLKHKGFRSIPKTLLDNVEVEQLVLSENHIAFVPPWLRLMQNLKVLKLESNQIKRIDPQALDLPALQYLDLRLNKLQRLPQTIAICNNLRHLNLEYNGLNHVPIGIFELENLETLGLLGNPIHEIPKEIEMLKNLKRVSLGPNQAHWKETLLTWFPNLTILP